MLDIDNKFRRYARLNNFEEFKDDTNANLAIVKANVGDATRDLSNLPKMITKEVRNAVHKQVERLQAQVERGLDMNHLLAEAF